MGSIAKSIQVNTTDEAENRSIIRSSVNRIFLLSPAYCGGIRAKLVMSERSSFPLAKQLREQGASLGALFSFMSGLYFRGKLAYAEAFANPPADLSGVLVITPGRGLRPADEILSIDDLKEIAGVEVDEQNPQYREPLEHDAGRIADSLPFDCEAVLLGSVATSKYLNILAGAFHGRLRFPVEFVGRGDMSRGGLMLRCVENGEELTYVELDGAVRRGPRPPKLPKKK